MCYYPKIETQIQRILNKPEIFNDMSLHQNSDDTISDVYDGELFRDLLDSEDGGCIISNEGFTFLINTDGIALSMKSETSIWPVMLVIDQIKSGQRFCLENVIFAGNAHIHYFYFTRLFFLIFHI
jgi:hypothetical protein